MMSLPTLLLSSLSATATLGQLMTLHTGFCWGRGLLRLRRNPMPPFFMMMMFLSTLSSSSPISATVTLGQLMTLHSGLFWGKLCFFWGYFFMLHAAFDALLNIVYIITFDTLGQLMTLLSQTELLREGHSTQGSDTEWEQVFAERQLNQVIQRFTPIWWQ